MDGSLILSLGLEDQEEWWSHLSLRPEYHVVHAPDLTEAQERLGEDLPAVILVNYCLLLQQPTTWLIRWREHPLWHEVPILAIAETLSSEERLSLLQYGITEGLVAPLHPAELSWRLDALVERRFMELGRRKSLKKLTHLARFFEQLSSLDPHLICQEMVDFVVEVFRVAWVSVWWYEERTESLVLGKHSQSSFTVQSVPRSTTNLMWQALDQGTHLLWDEPSLTSANSPRRGKFAFIVPMIAGEVRLGVVNFTNFSDDFFQQYGLDDLIALSRHITGRLGYAVMHQRTLVQEQQLQENFVKLSHLNQELQALLQIQGEMNDSLLQTSRELQSSKAKLEELNHLKNDFLAVASHDLRSPLSGIMAAMDAICYCYEVEPDIQMLAESVRNICQDQLTLINNLLDVSKIESGQIELEYKTLTPEEFKVYLEQICGNFELLTRSKRLQLLLEWGELKGTILLDQPKLKQVINNLISNAVKFTPEGGQVFVRAGMLADGSLQLSVQDTGIGIKPEDLERIFNKYEQVKDRSLGTKGERGTGLGLAICKNLVELHKGKIWVESQINQGSQFFIQLPGPLAS